MFELYMIWITLGTIPIGFVGLVLYLKWQLSYWSRIGIPTLKSSRLLFGDASEVIRGHATLGEQFRKFYHDIKEQGLKHAGVYVGQTPIYLPTDPELIKHVMQTDFEYFVNHGTFLDEKNDPLSAHLFNLKDDKWKKMRAKLTPSFTSSKTRLLFPTLMDCCKGLEDIFDNDAVVNAKDTMGRFSTDVVVSCGFGIDCNSLRNPNNNFRKYGKKVYKHSNTSRLLEFTIPHQILRVIKFKLTKNDVVSFFKRAIEDNAEYRETSQTYRKDFMQLLLKMKNEDGLRMDELAAQAYLFFSAGFETTSTTLTFALYEIAANPHVQEKLRKEVNSSAQITYDSVSEMTYLNNVLQETLRKYPPVPLLSRQCNKDYKIPNTNLTLKKGLIVGISTLGLHHDPEYFPNPEKFDPDRFTDINKKTRPQFTWIPFGEGPRICIGLRFGMLQCKLALATILRKYKLRISSRTASPLNFDKNRFVTTSDKDVWLEVEQLHEIS